jgi:hypothetical protein
MKLQSVLSSLSLSTAALSDRKSVLCGDGFMDFIRSPKSKILKILKKLKSQRFGSWLCFLPQVN